MKKKCELIREFDKEYNKDNKELCILTKAFKVHGKLYREKEIEGLITVSPAKIYCYSANNTINNEPEYKHVEWLHIFAENIIGFSFVE